MASLKKLSLFRCLPYLTLLFALSGCAEVRALISIIFNGANSLSTSAFEFDEVRSGSKVTCSILGDKTVRCLGSGVKGNLGTYNGGMVESVAEVKSIAAGTDFTCYIAGVNSQVFCFGRNDKGQLGNKSYGSSLKPVPVLDAEGSNTALLEAKEITAGEAHACALLKSGRALCWGDNSYGQLGKLGNEDPRPHSVLESEKNPRTFQQVHSIVAGGDSTCLIAREDASVFCFGERFGSKRKVNWVPERIEISGSLGTLNNAKQLGVGRNFGCALSKTSQVYCWGKNDLNQLGVLLNLPGITRASLVQVTYPAEAAMTHVEQIAVGNNHACAINRDEKTVYCWGDNRYGQLGNTSVRGNPEQVALGSNNLTLKGVKSLAVGPDRTCITSVRDEVYCWGNGAHGLLGSDRVLSPYPLRVLDANGEVLGNSLQISLGFDHSCILDAAQKMYCFGINDYGQLGLKGISSSAIYADQKPIQKVSSLDTYGNKTCMVHGPDQMVSCFGDREIDNINKKPERNSFILEELKRSTQGFKGALGVGIGRNHVCVIESSQSVSCITFADTLTPSSSQTILDVSQKPIRDIWQVRSRDDLNCGLIQESGSILCWGQWRGNRWPNAHAIPTTGKSTSEYIQVALSEDQICGVRGVERTVYCTKYGENSLDRLELKAMSDRDGKTLTKVLMISAGTHHFCAINEDSQLYCWGTNESGQLGNKMDKEYQKPSHIVLKMDRLRKVSRVSAGDRHTCVTTADDPSLFCFGESFFGGINSSEPVEYPL